MPSDTVRSVALRFVLTAAILAGLAVPLVDLWRGTERLSLLGSLQVDAVTYDSIGAAMAESGRWTDIPMRQPPGFVAILALVYTLFGHSLAAAKLMLGRVW